MNIVLLNLTRFGDLLQSQAAISDLAAAGHRVALVCQENFAGAAALLKGVAAVFPFQGSRLLETLDAERRAAPEDAFAYWATAVSGLGGWRDGLRAAFTPDTVINLTPSLAARLLALYIAGGVPCRGFALDEHGFGVNSNGWAAFLQSASQERGISPFNVVDVFRRAAESGARGGLGDASLRLPDESVSRSMGALLRAEAPEGCRGFVGLQLGASEDRRRWPVASFAELGDRVWNETGLCPVLFGSRMEQPLAERYIRAAQQGCVNLTGRTGLGELAAALTHMKLLITNDTGTMHLAAGLGVPVLAIFLATAQPFDTGPYRVGSCCVEPDMDCHPCAFGRACDRDEACRKAITPDFLGRLALERLAHDRLVPDSLTTERLTDDRPGSDSLDAGSLAPGIFDGPRRPEQSGPGARIWEAVDDGSGFMALRSLSGHDGTARGLWLAVQRRYIGAYLDRPPHVPFTPPPPGGEAAALPGPWKEGLCASARTASELALLFLQQGKVLAAARREGMGDRLLATWSRVRDVLAAEPRFTALSMLWVQETQARDTDLRAVLASAEAFHGLTAALARELEAAGPDAS